MGLKGCDLSKALQVLEIQMSVLERLLTNQAVTQPALNPWTFSDPFALLSLLLAFVANTLLFMNYLS